MYFSLMQLRCFLRRARWLSPGIAAAITAVMLFALTPCCEVSAAPAQPRTSAPEHDGAHGADHDHGPPSTPDPCLVWLDNHLNALDTNTALPTPERVPQPVPIVAAWVALAVAPAPLSVLPSCHSPPSPAVPLYLRIERLLI